MAGFRLRSTDPTEKVPKGGVKGGVKPATPPSMSEEPAWTGGYIKNEGADTYSMDVPSEQSTHRVSGRAIRETARNLQDRNDSGENVTARTLSGSNQGRGGSRIESTDYSNKASDISRRDIIRQLRDTGGATITDGVLTGQNTMTTTNTISGDQYRRKARQHEGEVNLEKRRTERASASEAQKLVVKNRRASYKESQLVKRATALATKKTKTMESKKRTADYKAKKLNERKNK